MPERLAVGRLVDRGTGIAGQQGKLRLSVIEQVTSSPCHLAAGFGLLSVVDEDAATSCDQIEGAGQSGAARRADILPSYRFTRSNVPATHAAAATAVLSPSQEAAATGALPSLVVPTGNDRSLPSPVSLVSTHVGHKSIGQPMGQAEIQHDANSGRTSESARYAYHDGPESADNG
jgi:hypothetical protein